MSWRKFLIIPKLIRLTARAPREQGQAWDLFWSRVKKTGPGGDVLWDLGADAERKEILGHLRQHLDTKLPIIDVGCGSGRQTRMLGECFPRALGVDVAPHAIELARRESAGLNNVDYRVLDMSKPGVGAALCSEIGEANVYIRGVLHVLTPEQQENLVDNIRAIVGRGGGAFVIETDFHGDSLDHLEYQGASSGNIPEPLLLCISSGVRPPAHFNEEHFRRYFPAEQWDKRASGATVLHTLPMHNQGTSDHDELNAYYAVVRALAS